MGMIIILLLECLLPQPLGGSQEYEIHWLPLSLGYEWILPLWKARGEVSHDERGKECGLWRHPGPKPGFIPSQLCDLG